VNYVNHTNAVDPSPADPPSRALATLLATARRTPGLDGLEGRIADLAALLAGQLRELERRLSDHVPADGRDLTDAARHLLLGPGKRLRPVLALVAGSLAGMRPAALLDAALAAELIHGATLLHDDVIDEGELRRGVPAARVVWGNSVSVLAGDLVLVRALQLVATYRHPGLLAEALRVLARMVDAEAVQLAARGRADGAIERYWAVVEGKTAALFEWAARAGALLAGDGALADRLGRFAAKCGLAFQVMDDLRDLAGGGDKTVLADVREGKVTLPVAIAIQRAPALAAWIAGAADRGADGAAAIAEQVHATGAAAEARRIAEALVADATEALCGLESSGAGATLVALARGIVQ